MDELSSPEKPKVKKKPIALIVALAVGGLIVFGALTFLQTRSTFMDYNYTLMLSAKAINLTCPQMIDEETRLDSVKAKPDKQFTYYYSLFSKSKDDLDSAMFCKIWTESVATGAKGHKDLAEFGKNGVTIIYSMNDKTGSHFCTVTLRPDDYYQPGAN